VSEPQIDLCLSGGGFRATLFHLGVVDFLSQSRRLSSVRRVFGVSGGSLLAAHLGLHWPDYLDPSPPAAPATATAIAQSPSFARRCRQLTELCGRGLREELISLVLLGWVALLGWIWLAAYAVAERLKPEHAALVAAWGAAGIVLVPWTVKRLRVPFLHRVSASALLCRLTWSGISTALAVVFSGADQAADWAMLAIVSLGGFLVMPYPLSLTEDFGRRLRPVYRKQGAAQADLSDLRPKDDPKDLPRRPEVHLLTSDLTDGGSRVCAFWEQGFVEGLETSAPRRHLAQFGLADAVAVSASFPGFFPPTRVDHTNLRLDADSIASLTISDGGVCDNLGIRAASACRSRDAAGTPARLVVSDASGVVRNSGVRESLFAPLRPIITALRASDIGFARNRDLEIERLARGMPGAEGRTYAEILILDPSGKRCTDTLALDWGGARVLSPVGTPEHPVNLEAEDVETKRNRQSMEFAAQLRTDLDRFDAVEADALHRAGFESARRTFEAALADPMPGIAPAVPPAAVARLEPRLGRAVRHPQAAARRLDTLKRGSRRRFRIVPGETVICRIRWSFYAVAVLAVLGAMGWLAYKGVTPGAQQRRSDAPS